MISDILSLFPGLLIKPHDAKENGEKEQPEHEIGRSPEKAVEQMADIEEKKRSDYDYETPGRKHQDGTHLACRLMRILCSQ